MRTTVGFLALILSLVTTGCASSGDLSALTDRVTQLEARAQADADRIAALETGFQDVARSAENASRAAAAAADRADEAARKADAIFKKSVSK